MAHTLAVKVSHLSIYALMSNMAKLTTLPTPEWCRHSSRTTTTSTNRLRHLVNWLRTPTSWVKSSTSGLESTGPLSPKMVVILPRRGRIWLSTTMSHKLLLFPMIGIGIPVECELLPLILIKDPTHVGQLCKVVDVVTVHHYLHFWSEAIDKLIIFGFSPTSP